MGFRMNEMVREPELEIVGEILHELYTSKISIAISWSQDGRVDAKLLDPATGVVVKESFGGGVIAAVEWLRDVAYDHYRDCAVFPDGY
jgi:hypothetical protein